MSDRVLSDAVIDAINRPTANASALPNEAYTSQEFFDAERDLIFSRTWTCVANACTVPNPGDARPVELLGMPLEAAYERQEELGKPLRRTEDEWS